MSTSTATNNLYTKIPADAWITINKRVSIILASSIGNEYYKPLRVLPQYSQLYTVSEKWKSTTFDQLIHFSGSLEQIAGKFISLLDKVCPAGAWHVTADQMTQVNALINQLKTDLKQLSRKANQVQKDLDAFGSAQFAADVAHGVEKLNPHWEVLSLASNNAFSMAQVKWDVANQLLHTLLTKLPAIQSQIANSHSASDQNTTLSIEVNLASELLAEKNNWQDIQHSARSFNAASASQRQFMDSDNWYYQDIPIDVNKYYQLGNRFSGTAGNLDYDPHTYYLPQQGQYFQLQLGQAGQYKTQHWKFIRCSNGWYQIVNGAGIALSYFHEKPYLDYLNDNNANQYWQCIHTDNGWFRLINLAGSNTHAIGVMKKDSTHQITNIHKKKFLFITTSVQTEIFNWTRHKLEAATMSTEANDPTQQWCLGASTYTIDHLNNQGYIVSKCLLTDDSQNKVNLAMTLAGDQILATPLNNDPNQKWTTYSYTAYFNGYPVALYAYVCQGKAIAYSGNNAPLTTINFDPSYTTVYGNESWLWLSQGTDDGWAKLMNPVHTNGQIWDIRGGCPNQPSTVIGTWNDNGGNCQHWSPRII